MRKFILLFCMINLIGYPLSVLARLGGEDLAPQDITQTIESLNHIGSYGFSEEYCPDKGFKGYRSTLGRDYAFFKKLQTVPKNAMPKRLSELPTGGGYKWRNKRSTMTSADRRAFCDNVNRVLTDKKPLLQGGTYCTHGGYIATLMRMTETKWWKNGGKAALQKFTCSSKAKNAYWGTNGASELFKILAGLGAPVTAHQNIAKREFSRAFNAGQLKKGDTIVLNRTDGSGHGALFESFQTDASGKVTAMCYFSSNRRTKGYGRQCERISRISSLNHGGFRE